MGWIIGDLCSVSGGIIGGLVPSVIWLGVYVRDFQVHLLKPFPIACRVLILIRFPIAPTL